MKLIWTIFPLSTLIKTFKSLKSVLKICFCNHVYQTWDLKFDTEDSKILGKLHGRVFQGHFRKCLKCDKGGEYLSLIPKQIKWKKTHMELPENKLVINVKMSGYGEETKAEKRDRILEKLLS